MFSSCSIKPPGHSTDNIARSNGVLLVECEDAVIIILIPLDEELQNVLDPTHHGPHALAGVIHVGKSVGSVET